MASIQSAINNILISSAVGATAVEKSIGASEAKKEAEVKAQAEMKKAKKEEKEAEKKDIQETQQKLADARQMAIGYTQADINKQKAQKALGVTSPLKKPRGVGQVTYDRRMANAMAMEEIQNKYAQNADFRERIRGIKPKALAQAMKPEINKKQGGKK